MKRNLLVLVIIVFGVSCTSNTIFDKPKDLISKDSMVLLLTDMYLATSAQSQKNKFLEKEENYIALVYEKHKVDSTRFNTSNMYYTSKTDAYTEILQEVKLNLDSLKTLHGETKKIIIEEYQGGNKRKEIIPSKEVKKVDVLIEDKTLQELKEVTEKVKKKAISLKKLKSIDERKKGNKKSLLKENKKPTH